MIEAALFDALRPWLLRVTGLPEVIRDAPGGPRPTGAYGMANITGSRPINWPHDVDHIAFTGSTEEPALEVPVIEWEWTVSVNVYATNAMDLARKIVTAMHTDAGQLGLFPLQVFNVSGVRRIPELIGQRWEGRAQLDIDIRGYVRDGVPVDVADFVTIDFEQGEQPVGAAVVNR